MTLTPGTRLGPYELVAPVGAGGMGEVWRARDPRLGREVAIKVLPAALAADPGRLRRFEQEARAASALSHPSIVVVHDLGVHEGTPFLVEELLEGETLRERLDAGPLPPRKAVELAVQVCAGLAAAHEKGIVHRDLKPENLFVTADGHAKILDFGVAKLYRERGEGTSAPTLAETTEPGVVIGTVAYMSPEQVRGQPVDHRTDLFSLGCVLYEMLTGRRAFHGDSSVETMNAILKEDPPELTTLDSRIPPGLARVAQHCLEKHPGERFQSARDLAFDLGAVTGTGAAPSAAAGAPAAVRWRRPALALGLLVAAGLAAGSFLLGRLSRQSPEPPRFTRLTFQRGTIGNARFAPDGKRVLYSASWDGREPEVFETSTDLSTTRPLGVDGVSLQAVAPNGELAVRRQVEGWAWTYGALAVTRGSGSAPRDLLEDVSCADWSPRDGALAVVRRVGGEDRLEMPPGRVLATTSGWFGDVRVSPDGQRVAATEHTVLFDTRGMLVVVDVTGRKTTLTSEYPTIFGVVWSPDGREVWFSAAATGSYQALFAVTLRGRVRTVARFPSSVTVADLARDGRALLVSERGSTGIRGRSPTGHGERELGWLDQPWPIDLSADGALLLLTEMGETAPGTYATYLRRMDGSAPVRLGDGSGCGLSPDGRWALAIHYGPPHRLLLVPTGPGETVVLPPGPLETYQAARFFADGRRIAVAGAERGRPQRTWVQDLGGGPPRPVTPEGTVGVTTSPDGRWVAAVARDATLTLFPLEGGEPRPLAKLASREDVSQWSADGRTLLISHGGVRLEVLAIDAQSGERRPWQAFEVPDSAGVRISRFVVTRDAVSYAYGYMRILDELYVVEGLR